MKLVKTKKVKYPYRVTFNNGRVSPIPSQHRFKTDFVAHHGCSLVAFYIALRFLGRKKKIIPLLSWSKRHLKKYIKAKLTIKGVAEGINKMMPGHAEYHKKPTYEMVKKALKADQMVLLETRDPIHTNVLFKGNGKTYYNASDGTVKKVDVNNNFWLELNDGGSK